MINISIEVGERTTLCFDGRIGLALEVNLSLDDAKRLGSLLMSHTSGEFDTE